MEEAEKEGNEKREREDEAMKKIEALEAQLLEEARAAQGKLEESAAREKALIDERDRGASGAAAALGDAEARARRAEEMLAEFEKKAKERDVEAERKAGEKASLVDALTADAKRLEKEAAERESALRSAAAAREEEMAKEAVEREARLAEAAARTAKLEADAEKRASENEVRVE